MPINQGTSMSTHEALRRDDDGRDAARHLKGALTLIGLPPRKASPFLDDPG